MKKLATLFLLVASFLSNSTIAQNTTCNAAFNVIYINGSTLQFNPLITAGLPSIQHYWYFGDGNASAAVSPSHTYLSGSLYIVKHLVIKTDSNGVVICRDSVFNTVQVQTSTVCNLVASFSPTQGNFNTVYFVNTTNPLHATDSVHWSFGDGQTSNNISPVHHYLNSGNYIVCLRVQQRDLGGVLTNCVSEICDTVFATNTCNLSANFFSYPDTASNIPHTYQFVNTTVGLHNSDSIRWTFGDGTSSNQVSPSHSYAQPGTYTVCLRVQQRDSTGTLYNCISDTCHTITVVQTPPLCNLTANFYSYQDSTATNTHTYQFVNTTVPLHSTDSIRWTFGDGTASNQVNPIHTYANVSPNTLSYTVCLRVQQRDSTGALTNCISEICHVIVIAAPVCNLTANFYYYVDSVGTSPYNYHFINTTLPSHSTDSVHWNFGDGSSSTDYHAIHTYAQPGTYTVCLRVQQGDSSGVLTNCVSEICHVVVIPPVTTCTLTATFYAYQDSTSGTINTFHFENTSVPLNAYDSIRWSFGDGTSSNQLSPNHTYAQAGTYTVCLRVQKRGPNGVGLTNCISEICHVVTVTSVCNIHANFSWHADSLNNRKIYFTNLTNPVSTAATILWNLGDGTTSTAWNPVHEYAQAGTYQVCLYVQLTPTCTSYYCRFITVLPTVNCQQQSNFNFTTSSTNSQSFNFTPLTVNNNAQYTWTFGDGTGSHNITTSHTYTQPGNYTACLTVYQNANCASTTCRPVQVMQQINCDSVHVSYNYYTDSLMPNRVYFHTISNYSVIHETWTITNYSTGHVTTLNQYNPTYTFTDTGYYYVCLRAETSGGCVKEYCRYIYIAHVPTSNVCNLQPYPNPGTNTISVNVSLNLPEMIHVYVYNAMNVLVKEKHVQGSSGNNIVTLPIGNLVAGMYTMRVIHGNSICYAQFVKL